MATTTLNADADSYIWYESPTSNFGSEWSLSVADDQAGATALIKTLLHFDLSGVSSGLALSPVLRLNVNAVIGAYAGATLKIYRLRVPFVESEATWNIRSTGNNWTTAGASDTTNDIFPTAVASVDLTEWSALEDWAEVALTSSLTQEDLTNGLLLAIDGVTTGYSVNVTLGSKERPGITQCPQLRVSPASPPTASLAAVADVAPSSTGNVTLTVTFADDGAVDVSTLATGNLTVTGPSAYSASPTFTGVDTNTDGTPRVATYAAAPSTSWVKGLYTVALEANQVCDTNSNYAEAVTLGTFCSDVPWTITDHQSSGTLDSTVATHNIYFAMRTPYGAPAENVTPTVRLIGTDGAFYSLTATKCGAGWYYVAITSTTHYPSDGDVFLTAIAKGCEVTHAKWSMSSTGIEANVVAFNGDKVTPGWLNDALKSVARGVVQDNVGNSTTVLYTTLPQRGTNGYANQFATIGVDSGTTPFAKTRFILSSADDGTDTVLTFERVWAAPPAGTSIYVDGNEEVKV